MSLGGSTPNQAEQRDRRMAYSASELAAISRLLDEALGMDAEARQAWLDALPAEHEALVPVLRQMLDRAKTSSSLLLDRLPRLDKALHERFTRTLKAGDRVGPYELVRELGSGGMAEVWLARRADGAYKREVALKLPKLTRLRRNLERHYERERDILASLEHPNIARLYDAGLAPDGLPYLALEYVQGQPLTAWCDAHRVGLRDRLQLLLQVIEAVKYAHDRQVIHRDLKPSNVFVTASGQVRLLDFGIAKLLEDEESDGSPLHLYTRALTPDYASPELLRGETVDSRADVYSLGALLYEMLSGDRPYRLNFVGPPAQLAAALDQLWIVSPSEAVVQGAGPARATTDDRLAGRLRGELDAVALKALALRPEERYASVAALAEDVQRYLSGERVLAVPERIKTEELVAQLSRNPNVRVRHRVPAYPTVREGRAPPPTAARSGRRVMVSAELAGSDAEASVWSRTYEVTLRDGFSFEDEVATTILEAVRAALDNEAPGTSWRLKVEIAGGD
jgi:eukaryotic-like serine/threonine-protein kinase